MKFFSLFWVLQACLQPVWGQAPRADNRMVAYMGNWHSCPTTQQLEQYDVVVVAFAVTYTWAADKNVCSETCEIATPAICGNAANPDLIQSLHDAGKKIIVSFGGAGMGGSWEGDVNDCWKYCFGRETQVVDRLVEIVEENNFDGVDIDYEWFSVDNQYGRGFTMGAQAISFLSQVTSGLRANLPAGSTIAHAPMDIDLVKDTAYYNMVKGVSDSIDYLMPQYYNGVTRPNVDGFEGSTAGQMAAADHYKSLVNDVFGGDATRVVFGFCINDCGPSGSNADASQAVTVLNQINDAYGCHGGAFFWVVDDDTSGQWSKTVNGALAANEGCVISPAPTPSAPLTSSPTRQPVVSPVASPVGSLADPCCPEGFTGLRAYNECKSYINCQGGVVVGMPITCTNGLLFDESSMACNWANLVTTCNANDCAPTSSPTATPTTAKPTTSPSSNPTATPQPTPAPSPSPSAAPSPYPSARPTWEPKRCCPSGYSGLRAWNDCEEYYNCANGLVSGLPVACSVGLLFDAQLQACNWAREVTTCKIDVCVPTQSPTIAPTASPTTAPEPTKAPVKAPVTISPSTVMPFQGATPAATDMPVTLPTETTKQPSKAPVSLVGTPTDFPTLGDIPNDGPNDPPVNDPTISPTNSPVNTPVSSTSAPVVSAQTLTPTRTTVTPTVMQPSPTNSPSTPEPTFNPTRPINGQSLAPLPAFSTGFEDFSSSAMHASVSLVGLWVLLAGLLA